MSWVVKAQFVCDFLILLIGKIDRLFRLKGQSGADNNRSL